MDTTPSPTTTQWLSPKPLLFYTHTHRDTYTHTQRAITLMLQFFSSQSLLGTNPLPHTQDCKSPFFYDPIRLRSLSLQASQIYKAVPSETES